MIRQIEGLLREYDPLLLELIRGVGDDYDPEQFVVELLQKIRSIYSERSSGTYAPILNRINHYVRLQDGSPVRRLSVAFSRAEQELYGTDEVNLAELPNRSEFLEELDAIIADVIRETRSREIDGDT